MLHDLDGYTDNDETEGSLLNGLRVSPSSPEVKLDTFCLTTLCTTFTFRHTLEATVQIRINEDRL
jgi:hypothetical protein